MQFFRVAANIDTKQAEKEQSKKEGQEIKQQVVGFTSVINFQLSCLLHHACF